MSTGGDVGSAQALSHELEDGGYLLARYVELLDDLVDAEILEILDDRGRDVCIMEPTAVMGLDMMASSRSYINAPLSSAIATSIP